MLMKSSGAQWIGNIPTDWSVIPIKYWFTIGNGSNPTTDEGPTPVYGSGSKSFKTCMESKEGPTVLLGRKGTVNIPQWVEGNYWNVDTAFDVKVKPGKNALLKYLYYCATCFDYDYYTTKTSLPSMTQNTYYNYKIPCIAIAEQCAIVSYLDDRCSKLDEIITEAEKSIEEYKELKQAVIFEAVTKGLDKNVPMKHSGVEWIREIPSTWNVIRIKYLLSEINNKSETGEEEPLSVSQVLGVVPSTMIAVSNPASSTIGQKIVEPGDLVFNKLKAHLGVFFVSDYKGLVSPDYAVYRANDKVNPKFLEYLFHTPSCITEFKKYITGVAAGLMRLYTSDLFNISIALPERSEQERITEYLADNVSKYDALISEKQSLIEDLKAYKKSLIYEVVTGKRRVV